MPPLRTEAEVEDNPLLVVTDMGSYSIGQEVGLINCDKKRQAYSDIIDEFNSKARKTEAPWWKFWTK